ncbi:MAG: phosphopantetheine-binding protein [Pseudomonadota bacterium]
MSNRVGEKVVEIIAGLAVIEPTDVKVDHTLDDLGVDSLGIVEAIFAIEEAFEVDVPFNANEPDASDFDISSVGAIIAAVERLIAEKRA